MESKHDGYGSFEDLDRANLDDVRAFHRDYYGPNNAVIAIAGDVTPARALALVKKHFGGIARRPVPPLADFSEPLNTAERRLVQADPLAEVPAVAAAWKMPVRGSADHAPMVVLGEVLAGGSASRLYQGLVKGRELALNLESLWGLTGPWEYDGPTLYTLFALYKPGASADSLLTAIDEEVARIVKEGVDEATLKRVKTRMKADWYNGLESYLGRADMLARLQVLWGDARVVSQVPEWIDAVTSAQMQRVAATYLSEGQPLGHRPPAGACRCSACRPCIRRTLRLTMKTITSVLPSPRCAARTLRAPAIGHVPAAPPAFPKDMPGFGADPVLPAPKITRSRLPNGLEVWVVPRSGLPRVDAVLAVRGAGTAADGPGQAGFTALLADLLSEGTQAARCTHAGAGRAGPGRQPLGQRHGRRHHAGRAGPGLAGRAAAAAAGRGGAPAGLC